MKTAPLPSPTPASASSAVIKVGILSALLFGVGGILLGIGIGNGWGLLVGFGGMMLSYFVGMAAIFAGAAGSSVPPRFNLIILLGSLTPLGGVALWWHLGGMPGAGAGVLLFGLGAALVGLGLIAAAGPRVARAIVCSGDSAR